MLKKMLFSVLFIAFGAISANAHQVVVSPLGNNKFVVKFWAHTGFEEYKPYQVLGIASYDEDLKSIKTGIDYKIDPKTKMPTVLTDKKPAIMTSVFDAGYWINSDNGYVVGDKTKVDGIVFDSLKSIKIGKSIYSWSDKFINPIGLRLEVVPLVNPLKLKVGDNLPVMVFKDGKPFPHAAFELGTGDIDTLTNDYGVAFIPIKHTGLNIIAARAKDQLLGDPKAQTLLIESSIDFEIK